jgi:endoglucanase
VAVSAVNKPSKQFLFDLLATPSPTGWEVAGQRKWAAFLRGCADAVESDAYGNAWATLKGTASEPPVVMLEAHADEIGFIVKAVTSEGFLRVDRIGGIDHATARGRRVTILGDKGPVLGVIGNTAIHLREREDEKAPKVHELYVDIGASNPKEVDKAGIRVGHPLVYQDTAEEFGKNRIVGRALDNRIGGFIIAEVTRRLAAESSRPEATLVAANCIHEEIGGMGSMMVAHRLRPDVCVVLDVTHATDSPGIGEDKHGKVTLGGGPSITHGAANHPMVTARIMEVAKKESITLQHEAASRFTGTDADSIYPIREGIPTGLVSLPLRYMHSVVEVADLGDVEQVVQLLSAFVRSVRKTDTFAVEI